MTKTTQSRLVEPSRFEQLLKLDPMSLASCDIARMNLLCTEGLPGAENLDVDRLLKKLDHWTRVCGSVVDRQWDQFDQAPEEFENSRAYWTALMIASVLTVRFKVEYLEDYRDRYAPCDWSTTKPFF